MICLKAACELLPGIKMAFRDGFEEIPDWCSLKDFFDPKEIVKKAKHYSISERVIISAILARSHYSVESHEIWEWGFVGYYELSCALRKVLVGIFSEGEFSVKMGDISMSYNESRFFETWKEAVKLMDPTLFGPKSPYTAETRYELVPIPGRVDKALGEVSREQGAFISAVVSFYDPVWGAKLAKKTGLPLSVSGLTGCLDSVRTKVVAELLRTYPGW